MSATIRRRLILFALLACGLAIGLWSCRHAASGVELPTLFTASSTVTALAVAPDGTIWAATQGGALCWRPGDELPQRWTTAEGLVSNDLRAVDADAGGAWVANAHSLLRLSTDSVQDASSRVSGEVRAVLATPQGCLIGTHQGLYRLAGDACIRIRADEMQRLVPGWAITRTHAVRLADGRTWPLPDTVGNITAVVADGTRCDLATALGYWHFDGTRWQEIALPPGAGSHISALTIAHDVLYAGVFGDGLYRRAGGRWQRVAGQPACFAHLTALATGAKGLVAGTREDGVWQADGGRWRACAMPPALPSADIAGLARHDGALWAATFEHGLLRLEGASCRVYTTADGLSSPSPRTLLAFRGVLYARHTTGAVDRFDGRRWAPAFAKRDLPRQEVYAMATDSARLYLGTWAGWAATDGRGWEHHFKEPALAGQVVTAIAADAGTVWLGTQKAGLFAYRNGTLTQYHESHGLTDDWITCIAARHGRVLIGTYTGGLLEWNGTGFTRCFAVDGFAIRDIALPATGKAAVATPLGVSLETDDGWQQQPPGEYGGLETQTLLSMPNGLWVGSRSALAFLRR